MVNEVKPSAVEWDDFSIVFFCFMNEQSTYSNIFHCILSSGWSRKRYVSVQTAHEIYSQYSEIQKLSSFFRKKKKSFDEILG